MDTLLANSPTHIPKTFSWVSWPSRLAGHVHVYAFLPISIRRCQATLSHDDLTYRNLTLLLKGKQPILTAPLIEQTHVWIPVELQFRQLCLNRLFRIVKAREYFEGLMEDIRKATHETKAPSTILECLSEDERQQVFGKTRPQTMDELVGTLTNRYQMLRYNDLEGFDDKPTVHLSHWAYHIAHALRHHSMAQSEYVGRNREAKAAPLKSPPPLEPDIYIPEMPRQRVNSKQNRFRWSLQVLHADYFRSPMVLQSGISGIHIPYCLKIPRYALMQLGEVLQTDVDDWLWLHHETRLALLPDVFADWPMTGAMDHP